VLQQKGIGETFRSRVGVRAMVGPNSQQMRAARYILSQPGVTAAKSSLLCGGPDWPTSVICGLLGLDCCSMLVGLTPIVVFTTPGTLLGAFMTEPAYKKINLDVVCVLIVMLVQLLMGVTFMSYINRVIATKQDILNSYPTDEEVAKLDAEAAKFAEVLAEVGDFNRAPKKVKYVFGSGVFCAIVSTYALMLGGSYLFQAFNITDCLDDLGRPEGVGRDEDRPPWPESPFIIWPLGMKGPGLLMILFMCYAHFCLKYFNRWARKQAESWLDEEQQSLALNTTQRTTPVAADGTEAPEPTNAHNAHGACAEAAFAACPMAAAAGGGGCVMAMGVAAAGVAAIVNSNAGATAQSAAPAADRGTSTNPRV